MFVLNKNRFFLPVILTTLIIFIFGFYYWNMLPLGSIHRYDEYHTLDRSNGFMIKGDWLTVYSNNEPYFKKPPLQYWLTALAITGSGDLEFALRIWSYLFGLGLLIATGLLAYAIAPANPYAIPAAVLILAGSSMQWHTAISAMLDAGAAFFFTVAVFAFVLAIRRPRWWYLVAVSTGLGALQKAPVGFVAVCGMLVLFHVVRKYHDVDLREILGNIHFRISALLASLLILWWPVLQTARYGIEVIYFAYIGEMLFRFSPVGGNAAIQVQWLQWIIQDGAVLWIPAILSLFMLPYFLRKPESLVPLALFFCFAIMMTFASGRIYSRYLILILPVMAAGFAALLVRTIPGRVSAVVVACVLTLSAGNPFKNTDPLSLFESSQNKYQAMLENFAKSLRVEETPVLCNWSKAKLKNIYPGAFSYFASDGRIFLELDDAKKLPMKEVLQEFTPPYRGLCDISEFEELKKWLVSYEVIERSNGYVYWTSTGTISPKKK